MKLNELISKRKYFLGLALDIEEKHDAEYQYEMDATAYGLNEEEARQEALTRFKNNYDSTKKGKMSKAKKKIAKAARKRNRSRS